MLLWLRCRKTFAVAALPALLNLIVLAPFFFGGSEGESAFSVTHVNVDRDKVGALDYATQFGSDIIFLQEIQPDLDSQLVAAMPEYQIVESNPEPDTRGSAMLVHKEWDGRIVGSEILQLNNYHRPLISATIEVDDHIVTLVSFHAIRPFAKDTIGSHGQEIQRLSAWAVEQEHPVVIVGDFNSTPWSSGVAPLRDEGLVVSMHGHGIQPTWPASAPSLLRIPIDICLHSPELTTTSRSIGEDVGSDHKPVHLEFGFASS